MIMQLNAAESSSVN